jgi:hypothetical protein
MAPEPAVSSPYLQEPNIGPYPEPTESNPPPPQPKSLSSVLIPSSHLRLGLPSGLFTSDFPTKILYTFLSFPHECHVSRPPHSPDFSGCYVFICALHITNASSRSSGIAPFNHFRLSCVSFFYILLSAAQRRLLDFTGLHTSFFSSIYPTSHKCA